MMQKWMLNLGDKKDRPCERPKSREETPKKGKERAALASFMGLKYPIKLRIPM